MSDLVYYRDSRFSPYASIFTAKKIENGIIWIDKYLVEFGKPDMTFSYSVSDKRGNDPMEKNIAIYKLIEFIFQTDMTECILYKANVYGNGDA